MKDIGMYLKATNCVAKHICELAYGKAGSDKATRKRDRMCEVSDLMEQFFFLRIADTGTEEPICDSAALTALTSFTTVNSHYTYTLEPTSDCDDVEDGNDEDVDSNADHYEDTATKSEDELRFVLID